MSPDGSNVNRAELSANAIFQAPALTPEKPKAPHSSLDSSLSLMERQILYAVLYQWRGDLSGCDMTSVRERQIEEQLTRTFQISDVKLDFLINRLVEKKLLKEHDSMIPGQPIIEITAKGEAALAPSHKGHVPFNELAIIANDLKAALS